MNSETMSMASLRAHRQSLCFCSLVLSIFSLNDTNRSKCDPDDSTNNPKRTTNTNSRSYKLTANSIIAIAPRGTRSGVTCDTA